MPEIIKEHLNYMIPGRRIWVKVKDPREPSGISEWGNDGNLTYVGYQGIATATFLVLDLIGGSGRKAQLERFSVNASDVLYAGVLEEKEQE